MFLPFHVCCRGCGPGSSVSTISGGLLRWPILQGLRKTQTVAHLTETFSGSTGRQKRHRNPLQGPRWEKKKNSHKIRSALEEWGACVLFLPLHNRLPLNLESHFVVWKTMSSCHRPSTRDVFLLWISTENLCAHIPRRRRRLSQLTVHSLAFFISFVGPAVYI